MKRYTAEEMATVLAEHKKWRETFGQEGSRADLRRANLCDADLCGANLCGADLRGADLRGADLCDADLCGADLCDADLCGANLCGADLRGADLRGADLCDADLCDADLCGAHLCGADLRGANLDFSAWPLKCGGTRAYMDRHLSLQLIYHTFNQRHQDPEILAALEPLRALAQEFISRHRSDATPLRGPEMEQPTENAGRTLRGKRVRRGPDWDWGDQDHQDGKPGLGTVISRGAQGWVHVRWDSGATNDYRMDGPGRTDLEVVEEGGAE